MNISLTASEVSPSRLRLEGIPNATPAGGWIAPLLEEVASVQQAVVQGDWSQVLAQSARCIGFGYAALRWIQGTNITARNRELTNAPLRQSFVDLMKGIATTEGGAELLSKLRDAIEPTGFDKLAESSMQALRERVADRDLPDKVFDDLLKQIKQNQPELPDLDASLKKLAKGKTTGVPFLDAIEQQASVSPMQAVTQPAIACLSRGLLAWVHAEFNRTYQHSEPDVESLAEDVTHDTIARTVDEFAAQLRAGQLLLYSAVASGQPLDAVTPLAFGVAGAIEARLPTFAHSQAKIDLIVKRVRDQGQGGESERLGALAVQAGALTREALATHAASYRLAAELDSVAPESEVMDLVKSATSMPFDCKLPDGKNTTLDKLESRKDGAFVEIEGVVQTVKAIRTTDKLVSHLDLRDPSSGAKARAAAVFVNLPHMGVTVGAYCKLHGTYRKKSELAKGKPAVEVDRLSLDKLAGQSWRIGLLQLADPWFPSWRNNAHMYWSLGPHEGFEDVLEEKQGAAEIIYLPIIRT